MTFTRWFVQSVGRLVRAGHSLESIGELSIHQFLLFVDIEDQLNAYQRIGFVADIGIVAGSMYSKGDPLGDHIDLLTDTTRGVLPWQQNQN